ncbi:hypothetical protein BU17DRAFT_38762 [Hysterangium stoloniferum]|nr:hypothetical protein BU17DRAFT_38762 [Hysterangium stoloniferum]
MSASSDLTFALYHAIAYLTRSLIGRYSATTIDLLHFTLERNLTNQFESTWYPNEPHRNSGRRCLTLIPHGVPPRPIYYACKSARISWEEWMMCLGNVEMDLFIDPGCVSVRFAGVNKTYIVWSAKTDLKGAQSPPAVKQQTIAQSIIDDDEDELFSMIADEIRAPTWLTPILSQFPAVPRPTITLPAQAKDVKPAESEPASASSTISTSSLLSVLSRHSRSSSRSSDTSSSGFSFSSIESAGTTATSNYASSCGGHRVAASPSKPHVNNAILMTPRRDRTGHVHIDASKTEVTPYDGGKTTVLTGGVMLGVKSSPAQVPSTPSTPRFAATPQAAGRKTVWRNPTNTRVRF